MQITSSRQLGQNYGFFGGMSRNSRGSSVLPPQIIPESKKNDEFKKACLDNLELEGLRQYRENLPMRDYYRMLSGEMAYVDIVDKEDKNVLYDVIQKAADDLNIPKSMKHWDLMLPIVNYIIGMVSLQNNKFRFDTTDSISVNDYIRERTDRLMKYAEASLKSEVNKYLLLNNITPQDEFNSEEEQRQYQAALEQIMAMHFPDKIDQDMRVNFKTQAANWSKKTWERDYGRFNIDSLHILEIRDQLLTGKAPRLYRVGKDYYYPEHWHPIETFHSKEADVTRFEDCEFAGRIKFYTLSELISTYGFKFSSKQRETIYKSYYGTEYDNNFTGYTSGSENASLYKGGLLDNMMVPFKGFSDHKLALEFEEATGIPLSEELDLRTGNTRPTYSMPLTGSYLNSSHFLPQSLRHDIEIRTDTIRVTEAYFRGNKKIGLLTYRTELGTLVSVDVDENLLLDFKEEHEIKNVRNISLYEFNKLPDEERENTIVWSDVPVVYEGIKIDIQDDKGDSIYIMEELPYQIKGEKGNDFDVKLPVCGPIGESLCKKIRPYQITYNYLMNQNQNYLEKELGTFFVIDVASMPTEYFDLGDGADALVNMRNLVKSVGLLPTDLSRNNLNQAGGLAFNPMSYQNATYTDQLNRNISLANFYKSECYQEIGLTPQVMYGPSQYSTAEGVQVGQQVHFSQTYSLEHEIFKNQQLNMKIHLAVAQYCQLQNRDANYIYMASNNEIDFIESIRDDEDFGLRVIDVRPMFSFRKAKEFEALRTRFLQDNTMANDAQSITELVMSDDFLELREAAQRAREFTIKMQQRQEQVQQQEADKDRALKEKFHNDEIEVKHEKNTATVKSAELNAMGRSTYNTETVDGTKEIKQSADAYLKNKEIESRDRLELAKIISDYEKAAQKVNQKSEEIALKREKLGIEREKLATARYIADRKNYDSVVNKN